MKIQVDTKQDSHDEIRKVIKLLMGIVGGHGVYTNEQPQSQPNIFDSPSPTPAVGNLMNLFDAAATPSAPPAEPQEEKTEEPKIEFY